jgi:hypothetical protein
MMKILEKIGLKGKHYSLSGSYYLMFIHQILEKFHLTQN